MRPAKGIAHDAMDLLVAKMAEFFERLFGHAEAEPEIIAFTDEWERNQIYRELHLN
jgi:hypothetical protein